MKTNQENTLENTFHKILSRDFFPLEKDRQCRINLIVLNQEISTHHLYSSKCVFSKNTLNLPRVCFRFITVHVSDPSAKLITNQTDTRIHFSVLYTTASAEKATDKHKQNNLIPQVFPLMAREKNKSPTVKKTPMASKEKPKKLRKPKTATHPPYFQVKEEETSFCFLQKKKEVCF